jgi:hypothetical protein
MISVLVEIGTPAQSPKLRGKSPGWAKGKTRTKPPRYPTVKKRVSRPKKSPNLLSLTFFELVCIVFRAVIFCGDPFLL